MENPQKKISFERYGDKLQVIIRDSSFTKIFEREVSIDNRKELEILLKDLRNKGVDLIDSIRKNILSGGSDWFD